jgi:hypothetical protein
MMMDGRFVSVLIALNKVLFPERACRLDLSNLAHTKMVLEVPHHPACVLLKACNQVVL